MYGRLESENMRFHTPYMAFERSPLPYIGEMLPDRPANLPYIGEL